MAEAIQQNIAAVVERGGRITGYTTALAFFGHATAETNLDIRLARLIPIEGNLLAIG